MANYYGVGRTNYFRVKDDDAFTKAMAELPVEHHTKVVDGDTFHTVLDDNPNGGGWITLMWDEDDNEVEIYMPEIIAPHLRDGEVAIVVESGHEKHRYCVGWAIAFNNKGEERRIDLDDITTLAAELGNGSTEPAY